MSKLSRLLPFVFICITPFTASAIPTKCETYLLSNPEVVVTQIFNAAGIQIGGTRPSDILVRDPKFYREFLSDPELKIGETYMDGMWDSLAIDQLTAKLLASQMQTGRYRSILPMWRTSGLAALALLKNGYRYFRDALSNRQTRTRSTTVATEHYDAGNELYRLMLDPTLTYTSGVWADGYNLEDAQNAKYDLIARKLDLKPGQHVLDIGSGFGGFARFAAKYYGAKVTGITISVEQLKAAKALSANQENVDFIYSDYRDLPNRFPPKTFDHVVSIEMIEAVGQKNLNGYFQAASEVLKDGGRFVIQSISSQTDAVNSNPWFSKYIFRDGVAPSINQISQAAMEKFGAPVDTQSITADYDKTLMAWHNNFTQAWPQLKNQYSERFKRMWDFYLLSVAGAFRVDQTHVNQIVFVKGPHGEISAVRDMPSRERLDSMRTSAQQIALTKVAIGALEREKQEVKEALAPRIRLTTGPLRKDARIAVIGAGPSGLSSALELKNLGYTNVVVFEKADAAGGKSHTVNIAGRAHDMGATMGVKGKYSQIIDLANKTGQTTISFPTEVDYDLASGGATKGATFLDNLKFAYQGLLYLIYYARVSRSQPRALEVPPSEFADSWSVLTKRHGMAYFGERLNTYITGYGYGDATTPAIFPARMLDPSAIIGAATSKSVMWENGTQPIWKGIASQLNVRTQTEVERIERDSNGVNLFIAGQSEPERFDKLILAEDPQAALQMLDATQEEFSVFSQVRHTPYATFAVRVDGFADGRAEVGYLKENMKPDREGHPMAWIKRYADDNVFIFHLFAPRSISDDQIMANITADLQKLGAKNLVLVDSRRWPFFPHVDSNSMRMGQFYERAWHLQGANNTVFVNEALAMSTMPDSAQLGKNVAQRLASGEY